MHEVLNNKRMWELKIKNIIIISFRIEKNVIYLGLIYTSKSS